MNFSHLASNLHYYLFLLRCLATVNNPPNIASPNPANPLLVPVTPVFGKFDFILTFSFAGDWLSSALFGLEVFGFSGNVRSFLGSFLKMCVTTTFSLSVFVTTYSYPGIPPCANASLASPNSAGALASAGRKSFPASSCHLVMISSGHVNSAANSAFLA